MNTTINEQLFIEQVLESVVSIQKYDRIDIETANVLGRTGNIVSSVILSNIISSCGIVAGASVGCIFGKDIGDIPINQSEEDKEIKIAIETATDELFDYVQEKEVTTAAPTHPRKIKKIISDSLCPSLLKTSDDIFEIAKSSTPVLLTLSLSGTISLPIQPVFFAAAAILLARSSIAAICKGSNQSASK